MWWERSTAVCVVEPILNVGTQVKKLIVIGQLLCRCRLEDPASAFSTALTLNNLCFVSSWQVSLVMSRQWQVVSNTKTKTKKEV